MPTYRLTQAAADDLVEIFQQGWVQFGLAQAEAYHADLGRAFDLLAAFPRAARPRDEIDPPVRAYPCKAHLIVYDIEADDIVVILRCVMGAKTGSDHHRDHLENDQRRGSGRICCRGAAWRCRPAARHR